MRYTRLVASAWHVTEDGDYKSLNQTEDLLGDAAALFEDIAAARDDLQQIRTNVVHATAEARKLVLESRRLRLKLRVVGPAVIAQ